MKTPHLDFAPFVSREHGDVFAQIIFDTLSDTEIVSEAFSATRLIAWPGEEREAAVDRYHAIADEIRTLAFELTKRHLSDMFTTVATVALNRERER